MLDHAKGIFATARRVTDHYIRPEMSTRDTLQSDLEVGPDNHIVSGHESDIRTIPKSKTLSFGVPTIFTLSNSTVTDKDCNL
jgi:hypothetical protein